ncbi:hypothetical protein MTO96_036722 [Rhipicephalus appendiculatus]
MSGYACSDLCEVYLCSTPLQQGNSINGAVNALSLLTSSSRSASGNSWAKHWLLVFDYGEDERYLAKRNIPKERIDQLLRKMCDCGQYHYTDNNCQKWAQDLLRELDIEIPSEEVDARTVVTNYIQPAAVAGATVVGACLVGALVYHGVSRRNKRE